MQECYASREEILGIRQTIIDCGLSHPDSLAGATIDDLRHVYNGAGPDGMAEWMRDGITFSLRVFKAGVAVHDWRFDQVIKLREKLKGMIDELVDLDRLKSILADWKFKFYSKLKKLIEATDWNNRLFTQYWYDAILKAAFDDTNAEFYKNMKLIISHLFATAWGKCGWIKRVVYYGKWQNRAFWAYRACVRFGWSAWMD